MELLRGALRTLSMRSILLSEYDRQCRHGEQRHQRQSLRFTSSQGGMYAIPSHSAAQAVLCR